APKNITMQAGDDFIVNAGKNVKIDAGEDMDCDAGKNISQTAGNDLTQRAMGDITETADNKSEFIEKAVTRSSLESTHHAEKVSVLSTVENMLLESTQKTVEINSAEQSNFF
ncbi:Vgr family protein, partial [Flavobacterium sp. ALJ2]|nr:Vgr family protein [Flavobacterium sp. ALJ2]